MRSYFLLGLSLLGLGWIALGCAAEEKPPSASPDLPRSFALSQPYRAWQGVAIDDSFVYVFTDRNEAFELENIISVYSHQGVWVEDHRNAYVGTDDQGRFMRLGHDGE